MTDVDKLVVGFWLWGREVKMNNQYFTAAGRKFYYNEKQEIVKIENTK